MKLTNRELEIITLISKGFLNKEIAERLEISKRTAESHIRRIYIKTKARNRSNAVSIFLGYKNSNTFHS